MNKEDDDKTIVNCAILYVFRKIKEIYFKVQ